MMYYFETRTKVSQKSFSLESFIQGYKETNPLTVNFSGINFKIVVVHTIFSLPGRLSISKMCLAHPVSSF